MPLLRPAYAWRAVRLGGHELDEALDVALHAQHLSDHVGLVGVHDGVLDVLVLVGNPYLAAGPGVEVVPGNDGVLFDVDHLHDDAPSVVHAAFMGQVELAQLILHWLDGAGAVDELGVLGVVLDASLDARDMPGVASAPDDPAAIGDVQYLVGLEVLCDPYLVAVLAGCAVHGCASRGHGVLVHLTPIRTEIPVLLRRDEGPVIVLGVLALHDLGVALLGLPAVGMEHLGEIVDWHGRP